MKKRFLLLTLIMCLLGGMNSLSLKAQEENVVTIGNETTEKYDVPFETYKAQSGSQSYYLSNEIGKTTGGTIDKIAYYISTSGEAGTRNIRVYLRNTNESYFPRTNGRYYRVNMTAEERVFEGTINTNTTGWVTIDIDNFSYEGENLLVAVYDYTDSSQNKDTKFYTYKTNGDGNYRTIKKNTSSANPEQTTSVTFTGEGQTPNIKLIFEDGGGEPATPTAPDLVSPKDETTISGTNVDLSWSYGVDNTATHYQVLLGTDNENLSVITDGWVARTELRTGFATEDEFTIENLEYGETYYWRVDVKNGEEGAPVVGAVWSFATACEFTGEGDWNNVANWNGGAVPGNDDRVVLNGSATITAEDIITVKELTIAEHASLTINGSLNITGKFSNTDVSKLFINDGGQIFQTNDGVKATFNMSINNPTDWENAQDGWQLISSPFTDASISDFFTTGDDNDYDLYKFDGKQVGAEWQNQKAIATFEPQFVSGRGYLASYQEETTATLKGTLNKSTVLDLTSDQLSYGGGTLADLYLIGNPFPFDMDMSKLKGCTNDIIEGYAVVDGGSYSYYDLEGTIPAGDGFFVKVLGDNAIFYYNHNSSSKSRNAEQSKSINIIASGNAGNDNVVVNFAGEGEGFPKLQNFNDDIATVYVQNNNANYGIYNCDENTTEIELCFNANQMGNYTISMEPNGNFNSIVLVDRFTGIETNMMVEDYHFTAMSEADNNRFILKLAVSDQQSAVSDNFVYQSGEDLIIEAEGTVQIIDVMGRMVYSNDVESNSRINVSDFNNGAYIVRVINEEGIKSQKVVIY